MSPSPSSPFVFGILVVVALAALACQSVDPWERAAFAAPRMQSEPHAPHQGLLEHVRQSREAIATGSAASGAGCGCY